MTPSGRRNEAWVIGCQNDPGSPDRFCRTPVFDYRLGKHPASVPLPRRLQGMGLKSWVSFGRNDVWVAMKSGLEHWDGSEWRTVPTPSRTSSIVDLATGPDHTLWAIGSRHRPHPSQLESRTYGVVRQPQHDLSQAALPRAGMDHPARPRFPVLAITERRRALFDVIRHPGSTARSRSGSRTATGRESGSRVEYEDRATRRFAEELAGATRRRPITARRLVHATV